MNRVRTILTLTMLVAACGGDSQPSDPPGSSVWQPTTIPFDPTCANCETIASGDYGHSGDLTLSYDPDVDDAIAQWGDCLESFRRCLVGGGLALACSEQSICPESCRADFESRIGGLTELPAQIEAFEAVYIDDGAPCLPPADEVQP